MSRLLDQRIIEEQLVSENIYFGRCLDPDTHQTALDGKNGKFQGAASEQLADRGGLVKGFRKVNV